MQAADASPVLAETDVGNIRRGQCHWSACRQVGLLAPQGEIDKCLQNCRQINLLLTKQASICNPKCVCRVLLTAPLESFTIGHTIVLSRGLLDVLPDEPSLAMVLAHEPQPHYPRPPLDAKLAFNDRMFFPDEQSFQRLDFRRRPGR